jgi:hypothetical protein
MEQQIESQNIIKPAFIKELPPNSLDVSNFINKKINIETKDSENECVKGINGISMVYYLLSENEFYVRKGDYYKVLRWRKQKVQNYSYDYILIPYKRKKPVKILQSYWNKNLKEIVGGQV